MVCLRGGRYISMHKVECGRLLLNVLLFFSLGGVCDWLCDR